MADARPAVEVTAPQRPRTPKVLIGTAVLGLVLLVVGGILFVIPQQSVTSSEPDRNVQIVSRVTEFATQYNTYDAADLDNYRKRLEGVLTKEYAELNAERIDFVEETLKKENATVSDPKVKSVAIESSDEDSAKVLVAVDATMYSKTLGEPTLEPMRWRVSMQKEGGVWKVDAYEDLDASKAPGLSVTPTPSASTPTTGADQ